ncbi:MAG: DNA recombination protein RmuC [Candidatus Saccharimonadales bacterium]
MDLFLIIGGLILAVTLVILWRSWYEKKPKDSMVLIQEQLNNLTTKIDDQLDSLTTRIDGRIDKGQTEMQNSLSKQLSESSRLIKDVTESLTKLDDTNKQVINVTDQLQSLQDILKNPKQRGVLGEYYLETVLKNVLPPERFALQHSLGKNEEGKDLIVDAAIFLDKNKVLPIDSKFSLENYNRLVATHSKVEKDKLEKAFRSDLKNRIDETAKYINPSLNTMDFAFMFIPSEGVYYDLLINKVGGNSSSRDLIEYAFQDKKVIIVSPTSFMAYLQTVMQGLRSLEIEENVRTIQKQVSNLNKHLLTHNEYMAKLGGSLGTTVNHYNKTYKELSKIDKDVTRIAGTDSVVDPVVIEKPQTSDD